MASFRKERVSELLREFIARELAQLLNPKLGFVTITAIDMSPDLKFAKVFWCTFTTTGPVNSATDEAAKARTLVEETKAALEATKSLIKRRIGEELKLRYVPDLLFRYDDSSEQGAKIDVLLKQI